MQHDSTRKTGGSADPASGTPATHHRPPGPDNAASLPAFAVCRARSLRPGDLIAHPARDTTEIIAVRAIEPVSDTIFRFQASDGRRVHLDALGMVPVNRRATVCGGCDFVPGRCPSDCPELAERHAAFGGALMAIGTDAVLQAARFRVFTTGEQVQS